MDQLFLSSLLPKPLPEPFTSAMAGARPSRRFKRASPVGSGRRRSSLGPDRSKLSHGFNGGAPVGSAHQRPGCASHATAARCEPADFATQHQLRSPSTLLLWLPAPLSTVALHLPTRSSIFFVNSKQNDEPKKKLQPNKHCIQASSITKETRKQPQSVPMNLDFVGSGTDLCSQKSSSVVRLPSSHPVLPSPPLSLICMIRFRSKCCHYLLLNGRHCF